MLLVGVYLAIGTGTAAAQLCGDADASGTVTVTDGVQVLRQAVGLSSSCTNSTCDVDGNGSVTVTDGVNVLRLAAGLAITANCPSVDNQVQNLLRTSLPIFGSLTKIGAPSGVRAAETQDCQDGGTVTINQDTGELDFNSCQLGDGFQYDGFFVVGQNTLDFGITFTDLATGDSESLQGGISQNVSGNTVTSSGSFDLASPFGSFSVGFDQLVLDPNTLLFVGGDLQLSADDGSFGVIQTVRLAFQPSNVAAVEVDLTDGSTLPFTYDLVSGDLTPVSN